MLRAFRRRPASSHPAPGSRWRTLVGPVLVASVACTVAACGDDDGTSTTAGLAGSYALSGVEGAALPLIVERFALGGGVQLASATLVLGADGSARDVRRFQQISAMGDVVGTSTDSSTTTWRAQGNRFFIDRPFPVANPRPDRLRVDTGTVDGGPLRLRVRYTYANSQTNIVDTTFVYVRTSGN